MKLRDYQINGALKACNILQERNVVYIIWSVRTGKTLTALKTADLFGAKKVLFLTKIKAISSIQNDYNLLKPSFELIVINNESMHRVNDTGIDLLISDEHHRLSAYPKMNQGAKQVKERWGNLPMIFLSGTPAAESGSQWFHSFFVCNRNPWQQYRNFYQWEKHFTKPKTRYLGAIQIRDYSDSIDEKILPIIEPYILTKTQEEAGFVGKITEQVVYCQMSELTETMVKKLLKNNIIEGKTEVIVADTPVKLMSKVHQVANGTAIFESGNSLVLDNSKAIFIRNYFAGYKLAIFYFFKKEYELLKSVFGEQLTDDLETFNSTDKHIALQQVAGSEGISLKKADKLIYYSFGYSGRNYVQGRDRLTTIDRKVNEVFFVFSKGDINEKIYKVIKSKKRYNEKVFTKDFRKYIRTKMEQ